MSATGQTYKIRTVSDFLAIPAERRIIAIAEFAGWCEYIEKARKLSTDAADLGIHITTREDVYLWVDDDKGEIRPSVRMAKP